MVIYKKGSVLLEMLVGLLVFSVISATMVQLISSLIMLSDKQTFTEFDFAIKQVTWQISTSNKLYKQESEYCFDYEDTQRCFVIKNKRLFLKPGTQIILHDYDSLHLFERDNQLWIQARKKTRVYEANIYTIGY